MPDSLLDDKSILYRLTKFPISSGIVPVRLFLYKYKYAKFFRFPISCGIFPIRLLLDKNNLFRLIKFPISNGILPDS